MLVAKQTQKIYSLCQFQKILFSSKKVRFLGFIIFAHEIKIQDKRIEVIKECIKPKSIWDIQIFIISVNFN